jgi:peptidyl-tRNA hydrolase
MNEAEQGGAANRRYASTRHGVGLAMLDSFVLAPFRLFSKQMTMPEPNWDAAANRRPAEHSDK